MKTKGKVSNEQENRRDGTGRRQRKVDTKKKEASNGS